MVLRNVALAVLLCGVCVAPVSAQDRSAGPRDAGYAGYKSSWFYLGANYGLYRARGGDFDDETDLIEGLIGYHFTPHFGIEASVIDFGEFGDRLAEADVDGWTAAGVLRLPVTETLGVYGKVGLLFWDAAVSGADDLSEAVDDSDFFYGIGLDFWVGPMVSLVAEYMRYEVNIDGSGFSTPVRGGTDIDAVKVGVRLNF